MTLPSYFAVSTLAFALLAFALLASAVAADDTRPSYKAIWITVTQTPATSGKETVFELRADDAAIKHRAPNGATVNLTVIVAAFLSRSTDKKIILLSDPERTVFHNSAFLVIKITDKNVTLAPGSRFPSPVTPRLAKRFKELGFDEVKMSAPDKLLHGSKSAYSLTQSLAVPETGTPPSDAE